MSLTDAQLFAAYGPKCSGPSLKITLFGGGEVVMAPMFGDTMLAVDACLRATNYRALYGQTGAFNCRRKKRPDGSYSDEWSTHALKITFDLNWLTNLFGPKLVTDYPPKLIAYLEGLRTNSGATVLSWGGRWARNKDAMHWQPACFPRDIASGIDLRTVPGATPPPYRPPIAAPAAPAPVAAGTSFTPPAPGVPMKFFITDPAYGIRLVITDGTCVMDYGVTNYLEQLDATDTRIGGPMTPKQFEDFCARYPGGRIIMGHLPS